MGDPLFFYAAAAVIAAVLLVLGILLVRYRRRNPPINAKYAYLHWQKDSFEETYTVTKSTTRIGRDQDNDLVLPDKSISRFHARLVRDWSGEFQIKDNNSHNRLYVDDNPVYKANLKDGTVFKVGSLSIKFTLKPPGADKTDDLDTAAPAEKSRYNTASNRKSIALTVRYYTDSTGWKRGTSRNISASGMYIETGPVKPGEREKIEIVFSARISGRTRWLRFLGRVVHQSEHGVGIQFEQLDQNSHRLLSKLDQAA